MQRLPRVAAGLKLPSSTEEAEKWVYAKVISVGTGTKCIGGEYISGKEAMADYPGIFCPLIPESFVFLSQNLLSSYSRIFCPLIPQSICLLIPASFVYRILTILHCIALAFADSGLVVNDSHAEIIARRGFMRFCYDQIQLLLSDDEEVRKSSIFVKKSKLRIL